MLKHMLMLLAMASCFSGISEAVHVIMTGGPALMQWEGLRIKADRHDNWWANFVRASTIRISQIQHQNANAPIRWIVFKPGYVTRSKEDGKPYVQWINDLGKKYKVQLVWVSTSGEAINALNASGRRGKIESFYYFGHSNPYALMLDYGNDIMAVSTQYIHETDLHRIRADIFLPTADCWSYGCYTGMSMSYWWRKYVGVPLWGNMESTRYGPVSSGRLPEGVGRWVK